MGLWGIWGAGFSLSVIADIRVMGDDCKSHWLVCGAGVGFGGGCCTVGGNSLFSRNAEGARRVYREPTAKNENGGIPRPDL